MTKWKWKAIRNCPGRYVLSGVSAGLSLRALAGPDAERLELHVENAPDKVVVVVLADGGLITYERADGSCVHTLNDPEGFARKLRQLGIVLQ
jgi:hypothetical protein